MFIIGNNACVSILFNSQLQTIHELQQLFSMLQQVMNHPLETRHGVTGLPSNSNWQKSQISFHHNTTEQPQLTWVPLRTCWGPPVGLLAP